MNGKSRKIGYILGAGFSFGTDHYAKYGNTKLNMPVQKTFFEELCSYHYKQTANNEIDKLSIEIRKYFNPKTHRCGRSSGSQKNKDLFGLSIEEIFTFFEEMSTRGKTPKEKEMAKAVMESILNSTAKLISYLSENGKPHLNSKLIRFVKRLNKTDVIITFNWDTLLDQTLEKFRNGKFWNRCWGYGKSTREHFPYEKSENEIIPKKYVKLLKLHGSINWAEKGGTGSTIKNWGSSNKEGEVIKMMPPKMFKTEITSPAQNNSFYMDVWKEAEEQLLRCRRLVFIGYSFPPTDFAVGNMLRRAISKIKQQRSLEIDLVDPNVLELAKRFNESFKMQIPIRNQYLSLENYLETKRAK